MIVKKISFNDRGTHFNFSEQVQAFRLNDFRNMLEEANFTIAGVYGNYKMEKFDELTSDRLILICKKKK